MSAMREGLRGMGVDREANGASRRSGGSKRLHDGSEAAQ
jgi:hypothetical protein